MVDGMKVIQRGVNEGCTEAYSLHGHDLALKNDAGLGVDDGGDREFGFLRSRPDDFRTTYKSSGEHVSMAYQCEKMITLDERAGAYQFG